MKRSEPAAIITWDWVVPIQNGSVTSADEQILARAERMFSLVQNSELDIGVAGFEVKPGSFGYYESQLDCPPGYLGTYRTGTCCKYFQKRLIRILGCFKLNLKIFTISFIY